MSIWEELVNFYIKLFSLNISVLIQKHFLDAHGDPNSALKGAIVG